MTKGIAIGQMSVAELADVIRERRRTVKGQPAEFEFRSLFTSDYSRTLTREQYDRAADLVLQFPVTLMCFVRRLVKATGGRHVATSPHFAIVRLPTGREITLPGPAERGWVKSCEKIVVNYEVHKS